MKKLITMMFVFALLVVVMMSSVKAQDYPDPTYRPEYSTICIDGYLWMMRHVVGYDCLLSESTKCTIIQVPVAQMLQINYNKKTRSNESLPMQCTDK